MNIRHLILLPLLLFIFVQPSCKRREFEVQRELAQGALDTALREAQDAVRAKEKADAEAAARMQWDIIFDGRSMRNWQEIEYAGHGAVELKDGAMHIPMGATLSGARFVGGNLPTVDYEVEVEARRIMGSDCFCFITFPFRDAHATFVSGGWGGAWIGISSINDMDAYENSTGASFEFDDKRWYNIRVRTTENRIQAWINDKAVVSTNVTGKEVSMRFGEIEESAPLGISTYTTAGETRLVRLRKLTPTEIAEAEAQNKAEDEF